MLLTTKSLSVKSHCGGSRRRDAFDCQLLGRVPCTGAAIAAASAPGAIAEVLGVGGKYFKSRREILSKHPMAYLCELKAAV